MDALKQQLLRIQQQLAGLTVSQKMLTVSLVVIMIMTMFYWSRYAGAPEKAMLLDQSMSAEEISQIKSSLSAKNVSYEVQGDRILVPTDKKFEILADLGYQQLLPRNTEDGFNAIVVKHSNPFDSGTKSEQLWNQSKQMTLGGIISRWPGVKSASVMIDGVGKRSPGRTVMPVAAVTISMQRGEQSNRKLAEAAADLLVGSQAGLSRSGVRVQINGTAIPLGEAGDNGLGSESPILEARARWEKYYSEKIISQLSYISNANAVVSVDLMTKSSVINEKTVDPKNKVELLRRSSNVAEENASATPAGEPGANANTAATIEGSGPAPGANSTVEKNEIENDTDHGVKNTVTQAPAGDALPVSAAVHVPEDYFVGVWKRRNMGSTGNPSQADLDTLLTEFTPQIRNAVRSATNIRDDTAITVARYVDVSHPLDSGDAAGATLASLPSGFGFGAKEIAIGVLAIVSLFMVSMMVRKSTPQPLLAATDSYSGGSVSDSPSGPDVITAGADMAGEVGEGGLMMTGRELTEAEIEAKQVIEQVGTMVQENPDAAANLIKRWLNRE